MQVANSGVFSGSAASREFHRNFGMKEYFW